MSSTTAISTALSQPPGPAPQAALPRRLSNEEDLYAEGNSFSDADWAGSEVKDLFGKDGFDFKDVLDIINPLHHLPVIGTAYRALTGDELAPAPRVLGGALFGGIAGFVVSLANAVLENETGADMGDTVLALFDDDAATPAVASTPATAPAEKIAAASVPAAPGALSIPAAFNQVKTGAAGASRPANESEDPVAALIRARAAVPARSGSSTGGLPNLPAQSAIALPGGKALPIQFRSAEAPAAANAPTARPQTSFHRSHRPAQETAAAAIPENAVDAGNPPRALQPTAAAAATESTRPSKTSAAPPDAVPDAEIALKMRTALDKYERLMKSRTAPSISGEI